MRFLILHLITAGIGVFVCQNHFDRLSKKGKYRVVINSKFKSGSLTYGDLVLPGMTSKEILFTSYLCHPSMANNELSDLFVWLSYIKRLNL